MTPVLSAGGGVTLRLHPGPEAPRTVRRCLHAVCGDIPAEVLYDAEVLTSEVVTNAVQHGRGTITITIESDEHSLVVTVADDSPVHPTLDDSADDGSTSGRGLQLVDRLATAWGCQPGADGQGKVVWFRLTI